MVGINRLFFTVIITLLSGISFCQRAQADEPELKLQISPTTGTQTDIFEFSVIVKGKVSPKSFPYLKGGEDFRLTLLGPETSFEFINGKTSQSTTYRYTLIPKRSGLLKTPSAEIELPDRTLSAEPLAIPVTKVSQEELADRREGTFLVQRVNKSRVYQGEQVAATLELYSMEQLTELRVGDLTTNGMLQLPLGEEQHTTRVIEGQRYRVTALRRALFPLQPGTVILPPREVSGTKVVTSQRMLNPFDPFSGFFGRQQTEGIKVLSNEESITVDPLPKPTEELFQWSASAPLVGVASLVMQPHPDSLKDEVQVGDDVTVTIKVTSSGNLSSLEGISLGQSPLLDIYAETPTERRFENSGLLFTEKTFRFSLVPHSPGEVSLPPFRLSYFDPEDRIYRTLEKPGMSFRIIGDPRNAAAASVTQPLPGQPEQELGQPQNPTGENRDSSERAIPAPPHPLAFGQQIQIPPSLYLFYVLASLAGLCLVGTLTFYAATTYRRKRELQQLLEAQTPREVLRVLDTLLPRRLGVTDGQSIVPLEDLVSSPRVNKSLAFSFLEVLYSLRRLAYGPARASADERSFAELKESARRLLSSL